MPLDIVIGTQWGDEGKGRIVDLLAARAAIVARFNGGDNAGHTVTVGSRTFKLRLIPSGIIHPHTTGVLGNGMVINPATFLSEVESLREAGVPVSPERLMLSYAAHLITPGHSAMDAALERARTAQPQGQIGTTGRGIGPAYTDKAARRGLRLQDMLDPDTFRARMAAHIAEVNHTLTSCYQAEPLDGPAVVAEYSAYARQLTPYIQNTARLIHAALANGRRVLAEGAQGTLLDLDHGTYPFVTSSTTTAAGVLTGLGIGIVPVERVIGVTKAFQTRVGAGPFPTEVSGDLAVRLRGTGSNPWDEYGTVTGRPRRVGWLDAVLLRYAVELNGLTHLVITKLDVLSGFDTLRICTAYRLGDQEYSQLPFGPADLSPFQPVYEELPGWPADLSAARSWEDLPAEARNYVLRVEELARVPVQQISVGPEREQVVEIEPWKRPLILILLLLVLAMSACQPAADLAAPTPTTTGTITRTPTQTGTIQWFPATRTPSPMPTLPVLPTTDQRPGVGSLLWEDGFTNRNQWSGADGVTLSSGEITLAHAGSGPGSLLSLRNGTQVDNFFLEITSSLSLCRGTDSYGLLLRALSAQDYYRFAVACSGQIRLERVKNGKLIMLQDWVFSGQVPPGSPLVLKLGVWAVGPELHLFVNDRFQFTVSDPVFTYGSLGVFARTTGQSPLTVSFSDLKVYKVDAAVVRPSATLAPAAATKPPAVIPPGPTPRRSATPVFQRPTITPTPTRKPTITPVFQRPTVTPTSSH